MTNSNVDMLLVVHFSYISFLLIKHHNIVLATCLFRQQVTKQSNRFCIHKQKKKYPIVHGNNQAQLHWNYYYYYYDFLFFSQKARECDNGRLRPCEPLGTNAALSRCGCTETCESAATHPALNARLVDCKWGLKNFASLVLRFDMWICTINAHNGICRHAVH